MLKKLLASILIVFVISFSIDSQIKEAQANPIVIDAVLIGGVICALIASGVVFSNSTQAEATARSFINTVIGNGSSDLSDLRVAAGQTLTIAAATAIAIKTFTTGYLTSQVRTPTDQVTWSSSGTPINFPVGATTVVPNTLSTPIAKSGTMYYTENFAQPVLVNIPVGTAGVASTLANLYYQSQSGSTWYNQGAILLKQDASGNLLVDATGYWSGVVTNLVNGTNYTISNGMITLSLGATLTTTALSDKLYWTVGGLTCGATQTMAPCTTQWAVNPLLQQANVIPTVSTTATIGQNTTVDGTKAQTDLTGASLQVLQQSAVANATTANLTLQLVNQSAISNQLQTGIQTNTKGIWDTLTGGISTTLGNIWNSVKELVTPTTTVTDISSGLSTGLTTPMAIPTFTTSMTRLQTFNTSKGTAPKFDFDLNALANAVSSFTHITNPFPKSSYTLIDFAQMDTVTFLGQSVIDYFRGIIGFGFILNTFLYCYRRVYTSGGVVS